MKLTKGTFKIAVNPHAWRGLNAVPDDGTRKGWIAGPLAIHGNKHGYSITHLASGLKAGESKGLHQTRELCAALLALPVDWTLANPLNDVGQSVRDSVRHLNREFLPHGR